MTSLWCSPKGLAGRALIERVGPHSEARCAGIAERLGDDTLADLYRVLGNFERRLDGPAVVRAPPRRR